MYKPGQNALSIYLYACTYIILQAQKIYYNDNIIIIILILHLSVCVQAERSLHIIKKCRARHVNAHDRLLLYKSSPIIRGDQSELL